MKLSLAVVTLIASASMGAAAEVEHHYETVSIKTPYTIMECEKKPVVQGALEGAAIGALFGELLGGGQKTENLAIFGTIVGANESQYQEVCNEVTKYEYAQEVRYSHSTVTFMDGGKSYTLEFQR